MFVYRLTVAIVYVIYILQYRRRV